MNRFLRRAHLVLTIAIGVPLLGWTLSGLAFTCFDFTAMRGADERAPAEALVATGLPLRYALAAAEKERPDARVVQVRTRMRLGAPVHVVELASGAPVVVDDQGASVAPLTEADVRRVAGEAFQGGAPIDDVTRIDDAAAVNDVAVPTWRVRYADRRATEAYVDPMTGEVVAWRTASYRTFDRLWSLHVFGFVDRTSPAHWPLRIAALLAALAALSGAGLLVSAAARTRRRSLRKEGSYGVS